MSERWEPFEDQAHPIERRQPTADPYQEAKLIAAGIALLLCLTWLGEQMPAPTMPVDPRLWMGGQ